MQGVKAFKADNLKREVHGKFKELSLEALGEPNKKTGRLLPRIKGRGAMDIIKSRGNGRNAETASTGRSELKKFALILLISLTFIADGVIVKIEACSQSCWKIGMMYTFVSQEGRHRNMQGVKAFKADNLKREVHGKFKELSLEALGEPNKMLRVPSDSVV